MFGNLFRRNLLNCFGINTRKGDDQKMLLPKLTVLGQTTKTLGDWKGLNCRAAIAEEELADCANISTEELPALTVCNPWTLYRSSGQTTGTADIIGLDNSLLEVLPESPCRIIRHHWTDALTEQISEIQLNTGDLFLYAAEFQGGLVLMVKNGTSTRLVYYKQDGTVQTSDITELLSGLSGEPQGLYANSRRLFILQNDYIHISYDREIENWQVYLINNSVAPVCAQLMDMNVGGRFTAGVDYKSNMLMFKRGVMYGIFNKSAPFYIAKIADVGCINPRSIAICRGTLYFLSQEGIMAYTGGLPQLVSGNCPDLADKLSDSTACSDGRYYYIGNYVYDTENQQWSKIRAEQSGVALSSKGCFNGKVYYLKKAGGSYETYIYQPNQFDSTSTPTEWFFKTKLFLADSQKKKLFTRLVLRVEPMQSTSLTVFVSADGGAFSSVYTGTVTQAKAVEIPLRIPPCESLQVKVSGVGKTAVTYLKYSYRVLS